MALTELLIKAILDIAKPRIEKLFDHSGIPEVPLDDALQRHVTYVEKWSRVVQQPEMSDSVDTDSSTVPLGIGAIPRSFRAADGYSEVFDENELLVSPSSFILLGAPGAGKTTTIKRISRHFLYSNMRHWIFLGDSQFSYVFVRFRPLNQ